MDVGNVIVLSFIITCVIIGFAYLFTNMNILFKSKSNTLFVFLNQLIAFCGVGIYWSLYNWSIFWLWKIILSVLIFDVIICSMIFVRYYISEHYYTSIEMENGILKKVHGSQYLRILKLPEDCIQIDENAFENLVELEEVYFGKNIIEIPEKLLENHYTLHTLHFKNPNTKYNDNIKEKYMIK